MAVDALWYVPNAVISRDLQTPTVKEEIRSRSSQDASARKILSNTFLARIFFYPEDGGDTFLRKPSSYKIHAAFFNCKILILGYSTTVSG
jgi:hypothetical protein